MGEAFRCFSGVCKPFVIIVDVVVDAVNGYDDPNCVSYAAVSFISNKP